MLKAIAVAVALVLLGAFTHGHAETCPFNDYSFTRDIMGTTRAAAIDSVVGMPEDQVGSEIIFNLVSGLLRVYSGALASPTFVHVRDAYDVVGVPVGTPLTITAELPVSGILLTLVECGTACGIQFFATVSHGTDSQSYQATFDVAPANDILPFSGAVTLPVTIVSGRPQIIEFELRAERSGGTHPILGQAKIGFSGLPPGATIVSCQGYGGIVATRRASWGTIKTLYR